MKRAIPICAILAAITVALNSLAEAEPEVRATTTIDTNAKEWQVTGEVLFRRGGRLMISGWRIYVATRRVPFEVVIPNEGGWLTQEMYESKAIEVAKAKSGAWELNYWSILGKLAWLLRQHFGSLVDHQTCPSRLSCPRGGLVATQGIVNRL